MHSQEIAYPGYLLDLMVSCWAQQPRDRPSASQIVSIATAPEFTHLLDVVSLEKSESVLCAGVTCLPAAQEQGECQFGTARATP